MRIALTFDDGPSEWTPPILDILAEHHAKATFFVCGTNILGNADTLRRVHDDGHEIGNHTTNHPNLAVLTDPHVRAELAETAAMVHAVTGVMPAVWRAPYLRVPPHVPVGLGVGTHVAATVIPEDWNEPSPQVIADRVLRDAVDGSVVLLHDGRPPGQPAFADGGSLDTRTQTVAALRLILGHLNATDFVTASGLLTR